MAIVAVLAVAFLAATGASALTGGGERKVIAEASSNGLCVEVTAVKVDGPNGEPPAATVKVAAFKRSSGEWKQLRQRAHRGGGRGLVLARRDAAVWGPQAGVGAGAR